MFIVRPKVAELVFQLYARALHPELFEVHASHPVDRKLYQAKAQITSTGHVLIWQHDGLILTEVATSLQHDLPVKRRLMCHQLRGENTDRVECRGGIIYESKFAYEPFDASSIGEYQRQLALTGAQEGIVQHFASSGRIGLGAMSYLHVEARTRSLTLSAVHTFPDDGAIARSRTRITLPS